MDARQSGVIFKTFYETDKAKENIMTISKLVVDYRLKRYSIRAISDTTLNLKRGKITALVGESGSGKSTLASAILNCIPNPGVIVSGEIYFHGNNGEKTIEIRKLSEKELNQYRWRCVSMVFQGAQSALNPVMTIFAQFYETMKVHDKKTSKEAAYKRSCEVLKIVNLDPDRTLKMYAHELSGGMKQRVMIAFSLLLNPDLIILDEPTTALDVITQDYILNILKRINREMGTSMLLLTHDIAVVAKFADYVGVMYAGKLVEYGDTLAVFEKKLHPYTAGLINATPSLYADLEGLKPIGGNPPDLVNLPKGCVFHPRCPKCMEVCKNYMPPDTFDSSGHLVKCHLIKG